MVDQIEIPVDKVVINSWDGRGYSVVVWSDVFSHNHIDLAERYTLGEVGKVYKELKEEQSE